MTDAFWIKPNICICFNVTTSTGVLPEGKDHLFRSHRVQANIPIV